MAGRNIAIVGASGTGKSTSIGHIPELNIQGLDPKETVIINVSSSKDLPFPGWTKVYTGNISEGGNYIETANTDVICKALKYIAENRKEIKNVVIDDAQFLMAFEFMARAQEPGYNKFSDIGVHLTSVFTTVRNLKSDLKVFYLWHPEEVNGKLKMKTVGNMIDNYLTLEGLFTVILYAKVDKTESNKINYQFVTNNDGSYPAKSPVGMFKELYIPNDLHIVSEAIEKYNTGEV